MKTTYEFNDDDNDKIYRNAFVYFQIIDDIQNYLRDTLKYRTTENVEILDYAEKLQKFIFDRTISNVMDVD